MLTPEPSRPDENRAGGGALVGLGAGLSALICLFFGLIQYVSSGTLSLSNPDSFMRLVRLRDELAAGHALQMVARDASGHGLLLHWSHLLEAMVALLATPLAWLMPQPEALSWAAMLLGPVSMAILGATLVWALLPVASRDFLWTSAPAVALSPTVIGYGQVGIVHHHILLAAAATALAGWTMRLLRGLSGRDGGLALAAWAVGGLWLSPEIFPAVFLAYAGLGWGWLRTPDTPGLRAGTVAAGLALPVLLLAVLVVDPPADGLLAPAIDHISSLWLAFALAVAATALAVARGRRLWACGVATASALLWLACFPEVLRGTGSLIRIEKARAIFASILEMHPVHTPADVLMLLAPGGAALLLLALLAWRRRSWGYGYAALCVVVTLVLAQQHVRFSTYAGVMGAAALPGWLEILTFRLRTHPVGAMFARVALTTGWVLLPCGVAILSNNSRLTTASLRATPTCRVADAVPMLRQAAGQVVLAHINFTPELLYRTEVLTVGSLYVRGQEAAVRLEAAWDSTAWDQPGPAMEATGARYVLVCRPAAQADTGEETLERRLLRGEHPDWLREVAAEPSGFVLYERLR